MLTWGLSTKPPSRSLLATVCSALAMVWPPSSTLPMSGKVTVPFSETRVSVVRSGFWNTVMRTMSPAPSAYSASCAAAGPARPKARAQRWRQDGWKAVERIV